MQLGIIADDFTGATDVAGFLVASGVKTTQFVGVPAGGTTADAQAAVISLKTRSCAPDRAVAESLAALAWLRRHGVRRVYQKYCSTFDSTARGNIGPVTDALLDELTSDFTVICPALPVNGRTTYNGYLFVNGVLLEESGMRHHPVNPMTDSHLGRLMEAQARGRAGVVASEVADRGPHAVRERFDVLRREGIRYAVLDALRDEHLDVLAEAVYDLPLTTGGSGLATSVARTWIEGRVSAEDAAAAGVPERGPAVVLSGSCSEMTRAQVEAYGGEAPALRVDPERAVRDEDYPAELAAWVTQHHSDPWAPLLYATAGPDAVRHAREQFGERAGEAIEAVFAETARRLAAAGTTTFIVAGGETSGAVVQALDVEGLHIGPQIAPGVPWVRAVTKPYSMALKSGNFGGERFYFECQEHEFPEEEG